MCRYEAAEDPVTIRELSLHSYLRVDDVSQAALGIFSQESHPSQFVGTAKEWGVFTIVNGCYTPGGRRLLRSWFQRPLLNLEVINDRLDAVAGP